MTLGPQATDRLMKELRDIYRSPRFKTGDFQVLHLHLQLHLHLHLNLHLQLSG